MQKQILVESQDLLQFCWSGQISLWTYLHRENFLLSLTWQSPDHELTPDKCPINNNKNIQLCIISFSTEQPAIRFMYIASLRACNMFCMTDLLQWWQISHHSHISSVESLSSLFSLITICHKSNLAFRLNCPMDRKNKKKEELSTKKLFFSLQNKELVL